MELRRKRAPTPPKSSRLQPSEPLHMTTRAASKAGSNGSNSRRGSLVSNGQISPVHGNDDGERNPKRRRVSTASKTTPRRASQSSQSQSTASRPSTRSMSGGNLVPIAETPLIAKKRKRSSDQTTESVSVASTRSITKSEWESHEPTQSPPETKKQPPRKSKRASTSSRDDPSARSLRGSNASADQTQAELNRANELHEHQANIGGVDSVREEAGNDADETMHEAIDKEHYRPRDLTQDSTSVKLNTTQSHIKRKRESNASTSASEASQEYADVVDDSPNGASMEQEDYDADADADADADMVAHGDIEIRPEGDITISLEVEPPTMNPTPARSAQASPAGSPPDSSMEQESPVKRAITSAPGDAGLTEDGGVGKGKKKLPGRRRAPHANPKVEAALRRQLHLRMNYRAVAKALKPILAELAQRSLSNIENDPKAHEHASEYSDVKEGLHQHFEHRLAWIQRHKDLDKKRLLDMFESEMEMRKAQYANIARNMQEMQIIRLQHDFLNTMRQHGQEVDGHASDEENEDVIPPLRHVTARGTVKNILGPQYHWRSRPAIETERLFEEMYQRHLVVRKQREHEERPNFRDSRPFTTFDPTMRDGVTASKGMDVLMLALEEVEKVPTLPLPTPLPNNEAYGLQALANASAATAATDAAMREAAERANAQEEAANKAREESIARAKKEEEHSRRTPLSVPKPSLSQPAEDSARSNAPTGVPTPAQTPSVEHKWPIDGGAHYDQHQQQSQITQKLDPQQQRQHHQAPQSASYLPPLHASSRPLSTFSQVALGPSLTETAPPVQIPGLGYQAPPHPIIPGLSFFPQPSQTPGVGSYLPPPLSISSHNHAKPEPRTESQTPITRNATPALASSQTPSRIEDRHHADSQYPVSRAQDVQEAQEAQEYLTETSASQPQQNRLTGGSFWDRLAKPAKDVGSNKVKLGPRESSDDLPRDLMKASQNTDNAHSHPLGSRSFASHPLGHLIDRPTENPPLSHLIDRPTENHPLGQSLDRQQDRSQDRSYDHIQERIRELESQAPTRPSDTAHSRYQQRPYDQIQERTKEVEDQTPARSLDQQQERHQEHPYDRIQERIQELTQERPQEPQQERHPQDHLSERPLEEPTDRASSRTLSTVSSIALESLSQKLRNTNDSFGPTDNYQSRQKKRAPKTSLYGPWPRSRNYDPFKNERDRRASVGAGPPDGPQNMHPHPRTGNYGTPDSRHAPYNTPSHSQPPLPFPASAPHTGYGPPPPQYAHVPPPYGYDQHASPYQQSPSYHGPTGFSSLPGPSPMSQPPQTPGYFGAPPPPFPPPHQSPYAPHPPTLAARPPASQPPYGPQYGGQPILPANSGPGGYGPNGSVHGSPPGSHAGPAFAQYHRDDGRRHEYGGRGGRGRHGSGHQEWKHYQGPR